MSCKIILFGCFLAYFSVALIPVSHSGITTASLISILSSEVQLTSSLMSTWPIFFFNFPCSLFFIALEVVLFSYSGLSLWTVLVSCLYLKLVGAMILLILSWVNTFVTPNQELFHNILSRVARILEGVGVHSMAFKNSRL